MLDGMVTLLATVAALIMLDTAAPGLLWLALPMPLLWAALSCPT